MILYPNAFAGSQCRPVCKYIDPREVELRKLREVADDMEREADEAEARLADAEKGYVEFIKAVEETYDGDAEGIAWFRTQCAWTEEKVSLQNQLEEARKEFKMQEAKCRAEQSELRRQIRKAEDRIEGNKKKKGEKSRENALQGIRGLFLSKD
ncbi:hypothetical protein RSAG8_13257, partial [Rhizoctonia solani AG-8 WAC10335]